MVLPDKRGKRLATPNAPAAMAAQVNGTSEVQYRKRGSEPPPA
jgi:hypothetical protein